MNGSNVLLEVAFPDRPVITPFAIAPLDRATVLRSMLAPDVPLQISFEGRPELAAVACIRPLLLVHNCNVLSEVASPVSEVSIFNGLKIFRKPGIPENFY